MATTNRCLRLSKRVIDALPASTSKETEYTDTDVSGLKLVVTKQGHKSFLLRYTFQGRKRAMKLGNYPVLDIANARSKALEAKRLLLENTDPQAERDVLESVPTLQYFCEHEYIPYAKQHKRSYADDISKLNTHVYGRLGHLRLSEISNKDIEQYLSNIRKDANLAPATSNRHLALLSVIFNLAIRFELLEKNPCTHIKKLKENNQRERFLSQDELSRLLAVMDDTNPETCEPNRITVAAIKLLLLTGTRREEALSAKWVDIDIDKKQWYLPQTKSGKKRFVQLNEAACELLRGIQPVEGCPFVFVNPRTKTRVSTPVKTFKRLLEKAKITNFKPHDLRHNFASMAVNSGASLYVVQHLLGHASAQTTQRYAHLQNETLLAASENIASLMLTKQQA
jgi:site-specific recombinase XerD